MSGELEGTSIPGPPLIGYVSEDVPMLWAKALDSARSLAELRALVHAWKEIVGEIAPASWPRDEREFQDAFLPGLRKERKNANGGGRTSKEHMKWIERFSEFCMPTRMIQVSLRAEQFKAPWGTVHLRMLEAGQ